MIASYFRKSKPWHYVILGLSILFVFMSFNVDLEELSLSTLSNCGLRLGIAIFFMFFLDFVITKNELTKKNSYAILALVLWFALFPESLNDVHILLASLLVGFALRRLLSLGSNRNTKKKFFDAAFWIILAAVFYPWAIVFLVQVVLALIYHGQNDIKNYVVALLGSITVFVLMMLYTILRYDVFFRSDGFRLQTSFNFSNFNSTSTGIALLVGALTLCIGLAFMFKRLSESSNVIKPSYVLLMVMTVLGILIIILSPTNKASEFIFLAVPFSIFMANTLEQLQRQWLKEGLLILLIMVTLARVVLDNNPIFVI